MRCVDAPQRSTAGSYSRAMNIIKGRAKTTALFMKCLTLYFTADMKDQSASSIVPIRPSFVHSSVTGESAVIKICVQCRAAVDEGPRAVLWRHSGHLAIAGQSVIRRLYRTYDSRSPTASNQMEPNKTINRKPFLADTIHCALSRCYTRCSCLCDDRIDNLRAPLKATLDSLVAPDRDNRNETRVSGCYDITPRQLLMIATFVSLWLAKFCFHLVAHLHLPHANTLNICATYSGI